MLKPLLFSVSLALICAAPSLSLAGGHGNPGCATCGLASPQGMVASPQSVVYDGGCGGGCNECAPKKKCFSFKLPHISLPKHTYTYEWVLKKKKVKAHKGCGGDSCNECGGTGVYAGTGVYPTSQVAPSGQATYAAPQYMAPAAHAAGQTTYMPASGEMKPALAADEVPPAPTIANGSSLLRLSPAN